MCEGQVSPNASLKDIIRLFLETEPAPGTPLILSPILRDDIPCVYQPNVEFEVPILPGQTYYEGGMSLGNYLINSLDTRIQNLDSMILNASPPQGWYQVGNSRMSTDWGDEANMDRGRNNCLGDRLHEGETVESPDTLAHPSPILFENPQFRHSVKRRYRGEVANAAGLSPNFPFPAYWVRTGNAFMTLGDTIEECERIMNPMGVRCRFIVRQGS